MRLIGRGTMHFDAFPSGGRTGVAIFVASRATDADFWSDVAPATGRYEVIVHLMGDERASGVSRDYMLETVAAWSSSSA